MLPKNFLKKISIAGAVLVVVLAVVLNLFRFFTPWAKQYNTEIAAHLSLLLGKPVTIQTVEAGWYWFQPVLQLNQITLDEGANQALHLDKLLLGIDVLKSLWTFSIQPGAIYVDDVHLKFKQTDGRWAVEGISAGLNEGMSLERAQKFLMWLSQQEKVVLKHLQAEFYFSNGQVLPFDALNLSIERDNDLYHIKGDARLDGTERTVIHLLGALRFTPSHLDALQGQIYFSAKNLMPAAWQAFLPPSALQIEGGKGDLAVWLDFSRGLLSSAQATLSFEQLAWRLGQKSQTIQSIQTNLAWKRQANGWQFIAKPLQLSTDGGIWPDNEVLLNYDQTADSFQLFVKKISLESLLSLKIAWPHPMDILSEINPHGVLSDTQIRFHQGQANYVLTRFDKLGWHQKGKIPGVTGLAGVVHWQPEEGRLDLDSKNLEVKMANYPSQKLDVLHASFDWKTLSDGLRLSIDHLLLTQPELTISIEGVLDQVTRDSVGAIRLSSSLSGNNLQVWLPYIPTQHLKPKLAEWLTQDIRRIGSASAKIRINGLAQDFPFDKNNGEFSIMAHVTDGELRVNPKWPFIREIEAAIHLNHRDLDVNLMHARFQDVVANQINLRVDDIGHDRETLLLHTMIQADAKQMLGFVFVTPLKEKLAKLERFVVKGLTSLDLQLDIPLYPDNHQILVKGDVQFDGNQILLQHHFADLAADKLSGHLFFDEGGVRNSVLQGEALGYPLSIRVHSEKLPKPLTEVLLITHCSAEFLKNYFKQPILSVLQGNFLIEALFQIASDPKESDSLTLKSPLQGLGIDLPAPLGKRQEEKLPLEVKLLFKEKKNIRVRGKLEKRLSADLLFQEKKDALTLQFGQLLLGSEQALYQNRSGLSLAGVLDNLDLGAWYQVFSQYAKGGEGAFLAELHHVQLRFPHLHLLDQTLENLSLEASRLPNHAWSFILDDKKIAADLNYQPVTNTLSGLVHRLHLSSIKKVSNTKALQLKPAQIPNLNLRIDELSLGQIQIGQLTLKSHSSPTQWSLEYCRIESPVYQFDIDGQWTSQNEDKTQLNIKLHVKDLAKSLERWDFKPVVAATRGDLVFQGGFNGAIYDLSLPSLHGSMDLKLRDGKITHLSPETEKKLGLGKLLSILSLQTLPRRLQLDFSDLSEGFSFDIFQGHFILNKGLMSTKDSYLDGPVAYASMQGDIDLAKRWYNLDLKIFPHITASLPVVATIAGATLAGGPLVGVAAWIANKIINQGVQKISAYSYKISGPWDDPVVQQVSIVKKQ